MTWHRLNVSRPSMFKRSLYDNFLRPRISSYKKSLDRFYLTTYQGQVVCPPQF